LGDLPAKKCHHLQNPRKDYRRQEYRKSGDLGRGVKENCKFTGKFRTQALFPVKRSLIM